MDKEFNQIELHYFFTDDFHGFDANVRNDCERELLTLFRDVIEDLDLKVIIEAQPPQDGGFREIWQFIGANKELLTLLVSVLTLIVSRFPVQNRKLTKLQIENLELDNQLKKEELKKYKVKSVDEISDSLLDDLASLLLRDYRVAWRRSNFFKKITLYKRISKISLNKLKNFQPAPDPELLELEEFQNFILFDENIPDVTDHIVEIDLISSALKAGKFRWKGFLNNQIVDFEMQDESFKQHVFRGDIQHNNKVKLRVVLNHTRKIDDTGRIKITKYYVTKVLNYYINNIEQHIPE